jgi:hypothetical protein
MGFILTKTQRYTIVLSMLALITLRGCDCFTFESPSVITNLDQMAAVQLRQQFNYVGTLPATTKLTPSLTISIRLLSPALKASLVPSNFHISGKITPQSPGSAIPTKLRLSIKHKSRTGQVILAQQFDANVQSSGTILAQNFLFNSPVISLVPIQNLESVELSVIPVDANLPACKITWVMVATFPPPSSTAKVDDSEMPVDVTANVGRELFQFFGTLPKSLKNHSFLGPISIKTIKGPAGPLQGNLNIKGLLKPIPAGTLLPSQLRLIIKHLDPAGKLLSTDTLNISVQTNGTIALQTYPFSTANSLGVKETLVFSALPVDKDFPICKASLTISYVASLGT